MAFIRRTLKKFYPRNFKFHQLRFLSDDYVKIVEVGPRDGLQNEKAIISTDVKVEFINKLSNTGLSVIEATSFVSPKWVPQLADNKEIMSKIERKKNVSYPVLVPNIKGFQSAVEVDVKEIAIFGAASEVFTKKNINCTIEESLRRFKDVCVAAQNKNIKIRGYVSCVVGCPYEGDVDSSVVLKIAKALLKMGCYEISLGDTIGIGTSESTAKMLKSVLEAIPSEKLAIHCHDTYGRALSNIETALEMGIRVVDSSVYGLGGCPYAKGASGNVATEKVVQYLHTNGMETGVDMNLITNVGKWISQYISKHD